VTDSVAGSGGVSRLLTAPFRLDRRLLVLVICFVAGTFFLRLPSFFEPPWHTDEGIFQAVAQRVSAGGSLYADAWESKPPLFLYTYVAILEVFGVGVLPLRFVATVCAIGAELALLGIGFRLMTRRQAIAAAAVLAGLLAVPFWEGNLAVTETFALPPTTLAVLCALRSERTSGERRGAGWLLAAGALFGLAFLIRQTAGVVAVAVVLWWLASGRPWLREGAIMALGSALVVAPAVGAFLVFGSFHWFWDANVGFFLDYVPSGQEVPLVDRVLILAPVVAAFVALLVYRRLDERPGWGLPALWLSLTLAAAMLTGRPYSHYLLQMMPPLALLVVLLASKVRLSWRPRLRQAPALGVAMTLVLLWTAVVVPAFRGNVLAMPYTKAEDYYANFFGWAAGLRSEEAYNRYFDKRVGLTLHLNSELAQLGVRGESMFIWGEYPWVYSMTGSRPATRYMTSFYTLLITDLDLELGQTLIDADPRFIMVMNDAWPGDLNDARGIVKRRYQNATRSLYGLIAWRYEQVATVGRARIFARTLERPLVTDISEEPQVASDEDDASTPEEVPTALR
jgi:4-amino-4-deoxy-L-arabinose transferase-like glycosyltransferase